MIHDAKIYTSIREAIHATATQARMPMKALAAELDWSPSELSMRTTLGGGSERPFPADDEHLIRIQHVTDNFSILVTMADALGFEVFPKRDRTPELMAEIRGAVEALNRRVEQLRLPHTSTPIDGRRRR